MEFKDCAFATYSLEIYFEVLDKLGYFESRNKGVHFIKAFLKNGLVCSYGINDFNLVSSQ